MTKQDKLLVDIGRINHFKPIVAEWVALGSFIGEKRANGYLYSAYLTIGGGVGINRFDPKTYQMIDGVSLRKPDSRRKSEMTTYTAMKDFYILEPDGEMHAVPKGKTAKVKYANGNKGKVDYNSEWVPIEQLEG